MTTASLEKGYCYGLRKSQAASSGIGACEYLMLKSFKAENFRCFRHLELDGLRRVNIIVGRNAAGKTVVLEAIKLALDGMPQTVPWLNGLRNIPTLVPPNPTAEQFQAQFLDLFHGFHHETRIEMWMQDSLQRVATLGVYFDLKRATSAQAAIGFQPVLPSVPPTTIVPLAFDRVDFQGQKNTLLATIQANGQMFYEPGKPMGIVSGFFSNAYFGIPGENAVWLSNLSMAKRSKDVIEAIHRHFPFIQEVTSETPFQGFGTVYADVPTLPRKLPLSAVSGGISRIFTLMLAVATFKEGVVLIDEVENGIFHDQYELVWKSLVDLARHHDTQLFISTHSKECLQAALPTIKENEKDFTLLRAERENGVSGIAQFDGKEFEAALAKGGEVRSDKGNAI